MTSWQLLFLKIVKQIADLKGPSLLRKSKRPENEKENHQCNSNLHWISKTGTLESLPELSSMAELTRVQAECQRYMNASVNLYCEPFQDQAPLLGNRAIYRIVGERETGEATHNDFFSRSSPFLGLFCLVFSRFFFILYIFKKIQSFFFFKNRKLSQQLYMCFALG